MPHIAGYRRFDARFDYLFNSYYESVGPRHARDRRGMLTRPALSEVLAWRAHVDAALADAWDDLDAAARILIDLGVNHEQQHQELLVTDLLHLFAANPLDPAAYAAPAAVAVPPVAGWTAHPGGITAIGHDGAGFAFDCEGPGHAVLLRPFALARGLVTNADWAAFVADGGYGDARLWLADGWAWVKREGIAAPLHWRDDGAEMTLCGVRARRPLAPVTHLSFYEADAFATWADARLPTEFEWEAAARDADPGGGNQLDGPGDIAPRGGTGPDSATSGRGPAAPFCPIPASAPPPARSANTTASS